MKKSRSEESTEHKETMYITIMIKNPVNGYEKVKKDSDGMMFCAHGLFLCINILFF